MIEYGQVTANLADLRQVMVQLNGSAVKICVVVDDDGLFLRTFTDGDVRRELLAGATLETRISTLAPPKTTPISVSHDASETVISKLFSVHPVQEIVQLDKRGAAKRLILRNKTTKPLLLSPPHLGAAEEKFVTQAFRENWIAPAGPNLEAFESEFGNTTGRKHALALSSGTAALHLALRVLKVCEGDTVYVSDLTFIASLQPIFYERAVPVLIDSEPLSWNMSPLALARRLAADSAAGTLPKAIIVVHIYGQSADMQTICDLADAYNVPIVEDATESLGATYKDRPSGSHGIMAAYSFNGNKMITTSGGGALVADQENLINHARNLATQGRMPMEHYQHSEIAYNYRMSNILAGIGRGQLEVLQERVAARRQVFARYQDGFSDVDGITFQQDVPRSQGCRWLSVICIDPNKIELHPYQIMRRLRYRGIETRPAWKPMHLQPLCSNVSFEPHCLDEYISAGLFFSSLCLPSGSSLRSDEQGRIIKDIKFLFSEL